MKTSSPRFPGFPAIARRNFLQGLSAGAGGIVFAPLLNSLAAQAAGTYALPKRVIFVLFDNGFHEDTCTPVDLSLQGDAVRELPLGPLTLPPGIEAFTPFKDRLAVVHGLRAGSVSPDHGAGFGALSAVNCGTGDTKRRNPAGESIDAAVAKQLKGIFPLLNLGIDHGQPATKSILVSSAWGPGRPIATQCRPELAYESLFGSIGANQNDFAVRKNLLDYLSGDIKELRTQLTGPERSQLEYHLDAMESLSKRDAQMAAMYEKGLLTKAAPKLPSPFPQNVPDTLSAQFDIAASALMTGLTNVVTITSGLCAVRGNYTGFSNMGTHAAGHNNKDVQLNLDGLEIVNKVQRFTAERTTALLTKLQTMPEGNGTMLDNTLLVYTSDSANRQHTHGENWPFVLLGNLGGRLKTNRFVTYPMREAKHDEGGPYRTGTGAATNPTINALYNTILHAIGAPRPHFNLVGVAKDDPAQRGPLKELFA
jgi:Protein of unknown function (DUF1552)